MQGEWKAWEHSAVNTAELPLLLFTLREHTPHRDCKHHVERGRQNHILHPAFGLTKTGDLVDERLYLFFFLLV
jgi:hypothetical protein